MKIKKINYSKKYGFEEYFINGTYMRKLYNMYFKKHFLGRFLDILVLFAILTTIVSVVMKYLIDLHWWIFIVINSFSAFVFIIFGLELLSEYLDSKTSHDFFKKHWIDFILVMFLSIYFLFVSFLGILNFFLFQLLKPIFSDLKELRIFYKIFKKE